MPVWKVASIEENPEVSLSSWNIFQTPEKTMHLCGYNALGREGRVSSAIVEFDTESMMGRTRSGRIYKLVGPSGYNGDAEYVKARWLNINKIDKHAIEDVTAIFENKESEGNTNA